LANKYPAGTSNKLAFDIVAEMLVLPVKFVTWAFIVPPVIDTFEVDRLVRTAVPPVIATALAF
jgi:hypothetical protein